MKRQAVLLIWIGVVVLWSSPLAADQTYTLHSVIDYRTINVLAPSGNLETVRLIGIALRESDNQPKAEQFLNSLLRGHEALHLEFDQQQRDAEDRLLAYVWIAHRRDARWLAIYRVSMHFNHHGLQDYWDTDGDDGLHFRCLNAELLQSGYVQAVMIPPNTKYQRHMLALAQQADQRRRQEIISRRKIVTPSP